MFNICRPSDHRVREFLASQKTLPFPYTQVGASLDEAPKGYAIDHNRVQLGRGRPVFDRAKTAIREWKMFDMAWVRLCWPDAPIQIGSTVGIVVFHLGFWSLNAARVVYVLDQDPQRYGFAYGTLPGHAEIGEERFSVEFRPDDESVWYDVYAFSRPHALAQAGYPLARMLQRRFARDSLLAMQFATSR